MCFVLLRQNVVEYVIYVRMYTTYHKNEQGTKQSVKSEPTGLEYNAPFEPVWLTSQWRSKTGRVDRVGFSTVNLTRICDEDEKKRCV